MYTRNLIQLSNLYNYPGSQPRHPKNFGALLLNWITNVRLLLSPEQLECLWTFCGVTSPRSMDVRRLHCQRCHTTSMARITIYHHRGSMIISLLCSLPVPIYSFRFQLPLENIRSPHKHVRTLLLPLVSNNNRGGEAVFFQATKQSKAMSGLLSPKQCFGLFLSSKSGILTRFKAH